MNVPADAPFVSRPVPRLAAGALALGVHLLFVLLLVFGVSWQTQHPAPVMVDVWESLPPAAVKPPGPEPVKPVPAPEPVAKEPPPPKAPDIALERKKAEAERQKKLQAIQAAEEKARAEAEKAAREKQLAERKKRELLRQMEDEELIRRMADEEAANRARLAKQAEARAAAGKRQAEVASAIGQYRDLISATVRGNTRLPDNLTGNPEVRCLVKLLPTGEVLNVRVTKSSGNVAYDEAVVRAIEKSSPLPLPGDRDARAAFVPELSFVHRPKQ
ncbi:MAG: cell envelope integrity protein TolA [Candidatus Thermoplasmatota archaeon]|nr:cell envelope integrity protein TolA [Candidatus Thermoplasmatota archaeon]